MVTGVAYDYSRTKDAMRISDMAFQKKFDSTNAEMYPDWQWTNNNACSRGFRYESSTADVVAFFFSFTICCNGRDRSVRRMKR